MKIFNDLTIWDTCISRMPAGSLRDQKIFLQKKTRVEITEKRIDERNEETTIHLFYHKYSELCVVTDQVEMTFNFW